MRILLTRWPSQSGPLEQGLRAAGLDVGFLPLTDQRLPEDLTALRAATSELASGRFRWLLLTSGTTVWALQQADWDGTVPSGTRIGVTGAGTARVLAERTGATDAWMPRDEASAAGILAELPGPFSEGTSRGERVLLPQSAQARPQLVQGLRAAGLDVTHVTAYETVSRVRDGLLPESGPEIRRDDVVLITSSTAALAWAQLGLPEGVAPRLLAIGRPTAGTLRELGLPAGMLDDVSAGGVMRALHQG